MDRSLKLTPTAAVNINRQEYDRRNSLQAEIFSAARRRKQHAAHIEEALRRVRGENASGQETCFQPPPAVS